MIAKHRLGLSTAVLFTAAAAVMWAAYAHPVMASIFGVAAILEAAVAVRFWNKPNA